MTLTQYKVLKLANDIFYFKLMNQHLKVFTFCILHKEVIYFQNLKNNDNVSNIILFQMRVTHNSGSIYFSFFSKNYVLDRCIFKFWFITVLFC